MAAIRIKRPFEYNGMLRSYQVVLDGKTVGKVANNDEIEIPLGAGQHDLRLKIDWCGSNTLSFSIAENETKTFEGKSCNPFVSIYYVIFEHDNFLILKQTSPA
jgi:hypothetical protein